MSKIIHAHLRAVLIGAAALIAAGCTTQIHNKDYTIQPTKVAFGTFRNVLLTPLVVEKSGNDSGDERAVEHIEAGLTSCLGTVFKTMTQASPSNDNFAPQTLIIEPAIEDLKKVNGGERFWLGALAGSSAVLLRTRYRDGSSRSILADPVFYAKANAMGGAWTFGATDNAMLTRIVEQACDYARTNY